MRTFSGLCLVGLLFMQSLAIFATEAEHSADVLRPETLSLGVNLHAEITSVLGSLPTTLTDQDRHLATALMLIGSSHEILRGAPLKAKSMALGKAIVVDHKNFNFWRLFSPRPVPVYLFPSHEAVWKTGNKRGVITSEVVKAEGSLVPQAAELASRLENASAKDGSVFGTHTEEVLKSFYETAGGFRGSVTESGKPESNAGKNPALDLDAEDRARLVRALDTSLPRYPGRELVYLEDDQGWSLTPYVFRTDFPGAVGQLEKVSWIPRGAGRFSTPFEIFRDLLNEAGYSCELVRHYKPNERPPKGFKVVRGATGNY